MKKLIILSTILLAASALQGHIIRIPADYITIQQGIEAAKTGDTVLVSPGTYVENISYKGKNITVASLFLTTRDTSYISRTIIDGNKAGSVVTFYSEIKSKGVLSGFTITNGSASYGGGIYCGNSNPTLTNLIIYGNSALVCGGGISFESSRPTLQGVTIFNNTASGKGGGIWIDGSNPVFDPINRCNIYCNSSFEGDDLYSTGRVQVIVDTFTVLNPNAIQAFPLANFTFDILHGKVAQAEADVYVSPEGDDSNSGLTPDDPLKTIHQAFSIILADSLNLRTIHLLEGTYSPSANKELFPVMIPNYISLTGVNDSTVIIDAEGTGRVIQFDNNNSSHLSRMTISGGSDSGIYCSNSSPVIENVIISGNCSSGRGWGPTGGSGGGMYCINSSPVLENVIITGNSAPSGGLSDLDPGTGGGMSCHNSTPILRNVKITGNTAGYGGGLACFNSNPVLFSVEISGNHAFPGKDFKGIACGGYYICGSGGGMYCSGSNPNMQKVTITNNTAFVKGGGIFCENSNPVFDKINRSSIYSNTALEGNDLFSTNFLEVVLDTFTVSYPNDFHATPIAKFSFDILQGVLVQTESDIYVSPGGDNSNNGLSSDRPLRTIHQAFTIIRADSLYPRTIHLLEGTYSPSANNEVFPVNIPDYISLAGAGRLEVIIDAEGTSRVMQITGNNTSSIYGMTITGGLIRTENGGGIYCLNSNPDIEEVIVTGNSAQGLHSWYCGFGGGSGGGIYCENSSPNLHNVLINNNIASSGGGVYFDNSGPSLQNVIISGNSSGGGGGIGAINSRPVMKQVTVTENSAAGFGGGIYFDENCSFAFDSINRCNIFFNNAFKGNDLYTIRPVTVVLDTFSVLHPNNHYANPLQIFTFNIRHGKLAQVNSDVYIASYGDDNNNGLTSEKPFKTIHHAILVLTADSLNPHTINLMDGYFSPADNGETMPVMVPDYVSLKGSGPSNVYINARGAAHALWFENNSTSSVSGLTVTGAATAGILFNNSGGKLENMEIIGNDGAGIRIDHNSGPVLQSILVSNNKDGGVSCIYSHPVLKNVTILGNSKYGMNCYGSVPLLQDVTITLNSGTGFISEWSNTGALLKDVVISKNNGELGGGMNISGDISPVFINVRVTENLATCGGGAHAGGPIKGVFFSKNTAMYGGGIYVPAYYGPGLVFSNLVIDHNVAQYGGGLYITPPSTGETIYLENITCTGNVAIYGGGIYQEKGNRTSLYNTILWDDYPQEIYLGGNYFSVNYSDVQGGKAGITMMTGSTIKWNDGNIDADPLFADTGDHPFSLSAGSPCIDAGSNTTGRPFSAIDILGNIRILDGNSDGTAIIDMGACEFVPGATGVNEFVIQNSELNVTSYPNPFTSATIIEYQLGEPGEINITIYNSIGQPVAALVNEYRPQGRQQAEWNAAGLPPGVYYFRLAAGSQAVTRRILKL